MKNKILKNLAVIAWISFALLSYSALAHAAEMKVGVIDMQKAIQSSSEGKKAKAEIEAAFIKTKKELDSEGASLKKSQENFQKKEAALSHTVKREQAQNLQQKIAKYQEHLEKSNVDIQKKQQEMSEPIIRKIREKVAEIAKKKSLNLVLEKNETIVIFSEENYDITSEVLSALNG